MHGGPAGAVVRKRTGRVRVRSVAAVLEAVGTPFELRRLDVEGPRDGEVLVRLAAAGACHSDHLYASGVLSHPLPVVLGHEGAGVVEATGPGVRSLAPGDHVVLLWRSFCGRCEYCSRGRAPLCRSGRAMRAGGTLLDGSTRMSFDGRQIHHFLGLSAFSEWTVTNEEALLRVPAELPLDVVAVAGCAVITGAGAVFNAGHVVPGDIVAVIGSGGVGVAAIAAAAAAGAARIVAVDRVRARLDFAMTLGATDAVLLDESGTGREELRAIVGEGADVTIEAAGVADAIELAVDVTGPAGTAVLVGGHAADTHGRFQARDFILYEKTIVGSIAGTMRPAEDFGRIFDLYRAGRLPIDRMIGNRYPLGAINEAYADLLAGSVGRSVLELCPDSP